MLQRMLRRRRGDRKGEEWMSLVDRVFIPDYYRPSAVARNGDVEVIEERCDGCGLCVKICPADTLVLKPREKPLRKGRRKITKVMAMSDAQECVACGDCEAICPNEACYVSHPVRMSMGIFKTLNKGPLSLPRLFNEEPD